MFKVYILKSILNGSYYIGSCEDIVIRLKRHSSGLVPATKRYIPWELIYVEEYTTLREARIREKQIKSWKRRSAIERLVISKI